LHPLRRLFKWGGFWVGLGFFFLVAPRWPTGVSFLLMMTLPLQGLLIGKLGFGLLFCFFSLSPIPFSRLMLAQSMLLPNGLGYALGFCRIMFAPGSAPFHCPQSPSRLDRFLFFLPRNVSWRVRTYCKGNPAPPLPPYPLLLSVLDSNTVYTAPRTI